MSKARHPRSQQACRAFTLVELLVVIAIFTILLAILTPALANARAASTLLMCKSNLRQIGYAYRMYANDNRDHIPDFDTLGGWFYRMGIGKKNPKDPFSLPECYGLPSLLVSHAYLPASPDLWICPAANDIDKSFGNTYANFLPVGAQVRWTSKQRGLPENRDMFLVNDNISTRPYKTGFRRGSGESPSAYALPATEYRLPHSFLIKSRSGSTNANMRRGAVNVLFIDGAIGTVLYTTDPSDPLGPPMSVIYR